ncbi:hypothetical protein cypCar_00047663 [Cyprinus carpio]|nr:hypothetical protein cypCar_00047663 [Cyprinus carpio]
MDVQQHHMIGYKEITVQTRIPDTLAGKCGQCMRMIHPKKLCFLLQNAGKDGRRCLPPVAPDMFEKMCQVFFTNKMK